MVMEGHERSRTVKEGHGWSFPIPFPLDFGFGIWDLDLGLEFLTRLGLDNKFGRQIGGLRRKKI